MRVYSPVVRPDRKPGDARPWALLVLDVEAREKVLTEEHGSFENFAAAADKAEELNLAQGLDCSTASALVEAALFLGLGVRT